MFHDDQFRKMNMSGIPYLMLGMGFLSVRPSVNYADKPQKPVKLSDLNFLQKKLFNLKTRCYRITGRRELKRLKLTQDAIVIRLLREDTSFEETVILGRMFRSTERKIKGVTRKINTPLL